MTELVYGPEPEDLALEFEQIKRTLKSIQQERWAEFLYLDQLLPLFDSMPSEAWETVKAQLKAVQIVDPVDYLVRIHVPVLAIFGEKDTSVPVERSIPIYIQYLGEAGNEGFTYKVFANADHGLHVGEEFADGYFELMLDWLRDLPVAKSG